MAHEIERNKFTGQHEFAYRGEKGWHGLGQQIEDMDSAEMIAEKAGFNFNIERAPVTFTAADGVTYKVEGKHVLYRSDDHQALGVVSDGYKITQPLETMRFFDQWATANGAIIETAGLIRHGGRYFVTARMVDIPDAVITGADIIRTYVLLASSSDGSLATTGKFTGTRVVCNNTVEIALGGSGKVARQKHNADFDPTRMKVDLGLIAAAAAEQADTFRSLVDVQIADRHVAPLAAIIMGDGTGKDKQGNPTLSKGAEKVLAINGGADLIGGDMLPQGSAWRFLNSVTQYVDHSSGRDQDAIWQSANFGRGNQQKDKAVQVLTQYRDGDAQLLDQIVSRIKSPSISVLQAVADKTMRAAAEGTSLLDSILAQRDSEQ